MGAMVGFFVSWNINLHELPNVNAILIEKKAVKLINQ